MKKSDATGSVTAIKPDDFNKGLRTTAQDALVGKVPGVNVVASSALRERVLLSASEAVHRFPHPMIR